MGPVVSICTERVFDVVELETILPVVLRITRKVKTIVDALLYRMEHLSPTDLEAQRQLETEIQKNIKLWEQKLKNLGGHPKGMWLVDWDSGDGYFCCKYPEPKALYWHGYEDGFSKRRAIKKAPAPAVWAVSPTEENEAPACQ